MVSLGSHANVWTTCLQLLRRRGYRLELALDDVDDGEDEDGPDGWSSGSWSAEKDGFSFEADNPIELLGLVALYEEIRPEENKPYWWSAQTVRERPDLWEQLFDQAIAAHDARTAELAVRRRHDPEGWEAEIRAAFELAGDTAEAAGVLRIHRRELRRFLEDPRLADLADLADD